MYTWSCLLLPSCNVTQTFACLACWAFVVSHISPGAPSPHIVGCFLASLLSRVGKGRRKNEQDKQATRRIAYPYRHMCPCFFAPSALPFLRGGRACVETTLMLAIWACCGCRLSIPSRASTAATQYRNIVQIYGSHINHEAGCAQTNKAKKIRWVGQGFLGNKQTTNRLVIMSQGRYAVLPDHS